MTLLSADQENTLIDLIHQRFGPDLEFDRFAEVLSYSTKETPMFGQQSNVYDQRNNVIGRIITTNPYGDQTASTVNGRVVGRYNHSSNTTFDEWGGFFARGNLLTVLVYRAHAAGVR